MSCMMYIPIKTTLRVVIIGIIITTSHARWYRVR